MPIGLLASGGIGEVASPSRILTLNASGMLQEAVWGSSGSIDLNANGIMQQASAAIRYATWDATRMDPSIALSNGALTLDAPTNPVCMAATDAMEASTASRYWEITVSAATTYTQFGVMPASVGAFGQTLGKSGPALSNNGVLSIDGVDVSTGHKTFAAGDVLTFALINGSLWVGTVAGGWEGDPAAGTGALATGLSGAYSPGFGLAAGGSCTATANFGASAWAGTPPAGCTGWIHTPVPMGLSGTLPTTATIGVLYSGTLTITGDYTAPVTIGGLPAWLSASTSGRAVTISGTPTAEATDSFTPTITDSASHTGTGSAQSIVISAASTSYITLSTTRKANSITLDGSKLVATTVDSGTVATIDAANCVNAATANRYWEVHIDTLAGGTSSAGLASSGLTDFGSQLGTTGDVNSMALASDGTFYREWGGSATGDTFAVGATLMFWLHNGSLYIGTAAGGWFGGATAGVPTTAFATGITGNVGPGVSSYGAYGSARGWALNFGASAWQGAAPAGATGWTE